jgi:ribose/xylose/arabinose/galactoside ABC-type transport system permease subunit
MAGIIMAAKLNSAQAVAGNGIELHIIAVTVIGGTSLLGGYGTILGTVMGTVLIAILENSLIIMNVSYFWQKLVLGLMIVIAVAMRTLRQERKAKAK